MINYHHILGITPNATLDQIKKAYRLKAKQLHPDKNNSANANEQFILLNEAYEFLLNTSQNNTNTFKRAQENARKQAEYQKTWETNDRQKARERAQEYARMKYEAYIKSDLYKTTEAMNFIADLMGLLFLIVYSLGVPILLSIAYGISGLILGIIISSPSFPFWYKYLSKTFSETKLSDLNTLNTKTIRGKMTNSSIIIFLNLFIFIRVTFSTLIEPHWIYLIYGIAILIGYLISFLIRSKSKYQKFLIRFGAAPLVINVLFLVNFFFSSHTSIESYSYTYDYSNKNNIYMKITLEDNKYENYSTIRLYFNTIKVIENSGITYEIKTGCFGFKVVRRSFLE